MLNDYFDKMIQEMYDVEDTAQVQEWEIARFTANIALKNLQMLDAIALRFKTSRASIVEEALNHAVFSMFISLNESDREALGEQCDAEYLRKMKEIAASNNGKYEYSGLGEWSSINYSMKKSEEAKKDADS